jgi:hypothetical protein
MPNRSAEQVYATIGPRNKSKRSQSERVIGQPNSKYATISSPGMSKRSKSIYDYQEANKDYYDWIRTPDPEDPCSVFVSRSSMTLQLKDKPSGSGSNRRHTNRRNKQRESMPIMQIPMQDLNAVTPAPVGHKRSSRNRNLQRQSNVPVQPDQGAADINVTSLDETKPDSRLLSNWPAGEGHAAIDSVKKLNLPKVSRTN